MFATAGLTHSLPFLFLYTVTLTSVLIALGFGARKISSLSAQAEYKQFKLGIQVLAPSHPPTSQASLPAPAVSLRSNQ